MRHVASAIAIAVLALSAPALSACSRQVENMVSKVEAEPGEAWSMRVFGEDKDRVFLVAGPDGKVAGARLKDGVSTLLDADETAKLLEENGLVSETPLNEKLSIKTPVASVNIASDDAEGGSGAVHIKAGGVSINVNGNGADNGAGVVNISGVNAAAATKFIDDINELSPEVKKQFREKLGL